MKMSENRTAVETHALRGALLIAVSLLAISAAIVLAVEAAVAHGNPEVKVEPNPAPFAGDVTIEGEGFEEEAEVSLTLQGVLGEISLGSVTTDSEGMFSLTVDLPSTATPGSYRIRAVGPDDVAIADVRIQEAEGGAAPPAAHETELGFHRGGGTAEIVSFAALAGGMVLLALFILWFPWKERHA